MDVRTTLLLVVALISKGSYAEAPAEVPIYELTLPEAESLALETSEQLKASVADKEAAEQQKGAAFVGQLPRLTLGGSITYNTTIPKFPISFLAGPVTISENVNFGNHWNYSVGPTLTYTLWDTLSSYKNYRSASLADQSRAEDLKNSRLQTLQAVRSAYVQVRLAIEELQDVKAFLDLTRAQGRDVATRFRAGAASRLDVVTSERSILNYEQQFEQRQSALATSLRDLFAQIGDPKAPGDLSRPAPPGIKDTSLIVKFDSLKKLLEDETSAEDVVLDFRRQPVVQSLVYQSDSLEYSASSQKARVYPALALQASSVYTLPAGPLTSPFNQNSATLILSAPLWLGDPTWHQAAQTRKQSESVRHREEQQRINIARDFAVAKELLTSLRKQRELATVDIHQSEEAARLYYASYQSGSSSLLDVQNANTQALLAKVTAARLDAQILTQLITLKTLSAEELYR